MSNNKKKIPQCCSTEEVTEVIQEYLNNSFTYNRLKGDKQRKIYEAGFEEGTQFINSFQQRRQQQVRDVSNNDY